MKLCLIRGFCGRDSKAGCHEEEAGALFRQLLAVMHALLSPEWATWLRGSQVTAHDECFFPATTIIKLILCFVRGIWRGLCVGGLWQEKLREVPAFEESASLAADIKALGPPVWLQDVLHSALHAIPPPAFAMPSATPDLTAPATGAASPLHDGPKSQEDSNVIPGSEVAATIDPWFFDGGFAECLGAAGQAKAPHWLQGALKRRPEST